VQLRSALERILVPDSIHQWALRPLAAVKVDSAEAHKVHLEKLQRSISDTERHLSNVTDLRVRGLIDDAEFLTRRQTLQRQLYLLQENARSEQYPSDEFEPEKALLLFSNRAIIWFDRGDDDTKRKILEIVSSNPTLKDRKLNVGAKKPFIGTMKFATSTRLRAERSGVRTFCREHKNVFLADFQKCVREYSTEKPAELQSAVANIKELAQKIDGYFLTDGSEGRSPVRLSSAA